MAAKIVKPAAPPIGHRGASESGVFLEIRVFCTETEM